MPKYTHNVISGRTMRIKSIKKSCLTLSEFTSVQNSKVAGRVLYSIDLTSNLCIMKRLLYRGDSKSEGRNSITCIAYFALLWLRHQRIVRGTILCFLLQGDIIVHIDIKCHRRLDMRHNLSVCHVTDNWPFF